VKTLRGITAPGILGSTVTWRAKKRKNLSFARHYDQIRFRFHTAKTHSGSGAANFVVPYKTVLPSDMLECRPQPEDKARETAL
jgi:hypothetical protein